jgi:hypothetical protein
MKVLGNIPDPYIEVADLCPFCNQPKRRLTKQSHPKYEGFYDTKCGYCLKTPRVEAGYMKHKIGLMNSSNITF